MLLTTIAWLIAAPFTLVLCYLALELLFGLFPLVRNEPQPKEADERLAILVPAHNEAEGIAATVAHLREAAPSARILVIADNCSDGTAGLARDAGAEVIERNDPDRRGKGYALAYGRDHLALDSVPSVLVIDADCRLQTGSAELLCRSALECGRPVQAANLLTADRSSGPLTAISNFAFLIKNLVRARGLQRLGGGSLLTGTGMAFPWTVFEQLPLSTANAVEDLQLGLWLAKQQVPVEFEERALVSSQAAAVQDTRTQRSRWEHGFMSTAIKQGIPLLRSGIMKRSVHLVTLGAHLLVPPLSLLVLAAIAAVACLAALCLPTGNWLPLAVFTAALLGALTMLLLAWWREGRAALPFLMLVRIPFYVAWKIPIYLNFFRRRQTAWNRTPRADGA